MVIYYDTKTGNVKRFIEKLGVQAIPVDSTLLVNEPFLMITYTFGFGQIPQTTYDFLQRNAANLMGVASSGNRAWGAMFGNAATLISQIYSVPMVRKFELGGSQDDVQTVKEFLESRRDV